MLTWILTTVSNAVIKSAITVAKQNPVVATVTVVSYIGVKLIERADINRQIQINESYIQDKIDAALYRNTIVQQNVVIENKKLPFNLDKSKDIIDESITDSN